MMDYHTRESEQRCFSLIKTDLQDIWEDIGAMPDDTDADKWKKKLLKMAEEYVFSSRFALMRIFLAAPGAQLLDSRDPSRGFMTVLSDGFVCRIEDITAEHAQQMTKEELDAFERLLEDRAASQGGYDRARDSLLIKKALYPVQKRTNQLTRQEAFQLGHALQFSLQEMEWFLLRVFDTDDGFRYTASNDLIEAYGFLMGIGSGEVDEIKAAYQERYGAVEKHACDDKEIDWTRDTSNSLEGKAQEWLVYHADDRNEAFLAWLGQRAAYLDLPSQTALRVYRNLAVYTHNLAIQEELPPDVDKRAGQKETDFIRCVREVVRMKGYADETTEKLFENATISPQKCGDVAGALLLENQRFSFSNQTDKAYAWHVIQVMTNGRMTVKSGVNKSRTRVRDILSGTIEHIEKSDMLYLLWFMANLCWFDGKSCLEPEDITTRLKDFIDASNLCLCAAGLPQFYPPHLIEQSMMLSVVSGFGGPEKCDPAEVYEFICSSLATPKVKKI